VTGDCGDDRSQPVQLGLSLFEPVSSGEVTAGCSGGPVSPDGESRPVRVDGLWGRVFSQANLARALQRVESNGGAPGVDAMTTGELGPWLSIHLEGLLSSLDEGSFRPSPVRRVSIPKPDGGRRMLGVPTVVDRLVQQAIAQVLEPIFDPGFSEHSYGFRPGRGAHQAVRQAQVFLEDGSGWVVDVDLDAFFDRVNHDKLMHRVWRRVADRRLLRLIPYRGSAVKRSFGEGLVARAGGVGR
jgi:retron-type reverse transcriptase